MCFDKSEVPNDSVFGNGVSIKLVASHWFTQENYLNEALTNNTHTIELLEVEGGWQQMYRKLQ